MNKIVILFYLVSLLVVNSIISNAQSLKDYNKLEFKFRLKIDTLTKEETINTLFEKYDTISTLYVYNGFNHEVCFDNTVCFYRNLNYYGGTKYLENILFFFPEFEYYNERLELWQYVNFNKLLGPNGNDPQFLLSLENTCISKGATGKFTDFMDFIGMLGFPKTGKYRVRLRVFFVVGEDSFLIKHTNPCTFYYLD